MDTPRTSPTPERSVRTRALRSLFLVLTGFIVVGYVLALLGQWREVVQDTHVTLSYVNRMLLQGTRTTLKGHELILRGLGAELVAKGALEDPERGRALIERMLAIDPGMVGFGLARPDGRLVLVSGVAADAPLPDLSRTPASRESFLEALRTGRIQPGRPYFMPLLGHWVTPIRTPIHGPEGEVVAVMAAGYAISGGTTAWANQSLPPDVQSALIRDDGYLLYVDPLPATPVDSLQAVYGAPVAEALRRDMARAGRGELFATRAAPGDGETRLALMGRLPQLGLTAVSSVSRTALWREFAVSMAFPTGLLLLYLVAGYWTYRRSATFQVRSESEVAALNAWRRAVLDGADYAIIATGTDGRIVTVNRAAERMLGYPTEELLGSGTPARFHDGAELTERAAQLSIELGRPVTPGFEVLVAHPRAGRAEEREWTYLARDGSRLPVRLSMSALHDADGAITGFLGIAADLTEQHRARASLRDSEARYRSLFEGISDSVFLTDGVRFLDCNPASLRMFRCTREQVIGEVPARFSPELQPDGERSDMVARRRIERALGGEATSFDWRHLRCDGSAFDAEVTLNRVDLGEHPHILATVRDVSERKEAERQLAESRQVLMRSNENLQLINDLSTRLHGTSRLDTITRETVAVLTGLSETPNVAVYLLEDEADTLRLAAVHGVVAEIVQPGSELPLKGSLTGFALSGERITVSADLATDSRLEPRLRSALAERGLNSGLVIPLVYDGRPLGSINLAYGGTRTFEAMELDTLRALGAAVSLAIANCRHLNALEHQAYHDSLTGLPNRDQLHRQVGPMLAQGDGSAALSALLLVDLDHFKDVNDTLGHQVGDLLLRQIGPRLQGDEPWRPELLCRLGGDEFALFFRGLADADAARDAAHHVLACLQRPFEVDGISLSISASVGVALYPQDGSRDHELLRAADVAMYAAKRAGCGVMLYDPGQDLHSPERLTMVTDLEQGIRAGQLVLHFQPQVDLASGRIAAFEALVRWRHPTLGLLYPDRFLPQAEVSEVIQPLTEEVLRLALEQQQAWKDEGLRFRMAVNLSVRNLVDDRFVALIGELMQRYGAEPGDLELEITETALMHDPESAGQRLECIAALGAGLAIDDFGTGFSSLSYLRRWPLSALKIDRLFVGEMRANEADSIIVRSTVALAHNLGLKVVAEGVEDAVTQGELAAMGCDLAQGYHLCRPGPWEELRETLGIRGAAGTGDPRRSAASGQ